eukprot:PhF_6_TR14250/c0_g1_i4/m.22878
MIDLPLLERISNLQSTIRNFTTSNDDYSRSITSPPSPPRLSTTSTMSPRNNTCEHCDKVQTQIFRLRSEILDSIPHEDAEGLFPSSSSSSVIRGEDIIGWKDTDSTTAEQSEAFLSCGPQVIPIRMVKLRSGVPPDLSILKYRCPYWIPFLTTYQNPATNIRYLITARKQSTMVPLQQWVRTHDNVDADTIRLKLDLCFDIACGLYALHKVKVLHRNLTWKNVFVDMSRGKGFLDGYAIHEGAPDTEFTSPESMRD